MSLERGETAFEFADDIGDAQQILTRLVHLAFGGTLAQLELADAGCLFDHRAAVLRFGGDDVPDAALLDDRVRTLANAGAQEQVRDVEQPNRSPIDEVVAVALAIETPGDLNLRVIAVVRRGEAVGVVERERDLSETMRPAPLRAAEDHVLHVFAAEAGGRLLAHAPLDGVHDIGFATAVRPDDTGDVVVEMDRRLVDEGFEANDLELLDLHDAPQRSSWTWLSLNIRYCNGLRDQKRGSVGDPHYIWWSGDAPPPRLKPVGGGSYSDSASEGASATASSEATLVGSDGA